MKTVHFSLYVGSFVLLFLSGCASYQSSPLRRLKTVKAETAVKKGKILFAHRVYSKEDCEKYLGRDVIHAGYQPVQLTITNSTPKNLLFSSSEVSLPCANVNVVKDLVHTSTLARAAGYGIPGLALTALPFTPTIFGAWAWLGPSFAAPFMMFPGLVLIGVAVTDSIWSSQANKRLDADYDSKALTELTLKPGQTLNGVVFISLSEFKQNFTVTLADIKTADKFVLEASPEMHAKFF